MGVAEKMRMMHMMHMMHMMYMMLAMVVGREDAQQPNLDTPYYTLKELHNYTSFCTCRHQITTLLHTSPHL